MSNNSTTTITTERKLFIHKLITEQQIETLTEELNKDKLSLGDNFNVDSLYAIENADNITLLMTSVKEANIQMIRLLHKQFNADLNVIDKNQRTCIFYCVEIKAYHKAESILQYLITNGCKTNVIDKDGKSPFYVAICNNNLQAAYTLYAEGNADVNIKLDKDENTILHEAVKSGNVSNVNFLVNQCAADLGKKNLKGEIPFFLALQYPRMINQILKDLANNHKENKLLKTNSSSRESFDAIEYVANLVRIVDNDTKQNAIHKCALNGYIHSLGELLTHLPEQLVKDLTKEKDVNGNIPLHLAVQAGSAEICFALSQLNPSDCLIQNNNGDTPLHIALKTSLYKCARVLFPHTKTFTGQNAKGETIQVLLNAFKDELKGEEDIAKQLAEIDLTIPENYRFGRLITDFTFIAKMKDFLALNRNQDMMIFYETIQDFKMSPSSPDRYHIAEQIVDHFLVDNAPSKIKFLKNAIQPFMVKFSECTAEHCPKDLFYSLENLALKSLREEHFPKFVKSKLFMKYLERKKAQDPTFLIRFVKSDLSSEGNDTESKSAKGTASNNNTGGNNTGSSSKDNMKSSSDSDEILEDEIDREKLKFCHKCGTELIDLDNLIFTEREFKKRYEELKDLNQWRIIDEATDGKTYSSPPEYHNHLSNSRRHTQVKYIGEIECSSHALFNMWIDPNFFQSREQRLESAKQIDFIKGDKYATVVYHEIYKMKFPHTNRDFSHAFCCSYNEDEQRYMCISRSVNHPKAPETSKMVRGEVKTSFLVERVSDTKCRYYYSVTADFGGWLPIDFYASFVKNQSEYIHSNLLKLVKQREMLGGKRPDRGLVQSLDYYLAKKN